jgi:hypothetical protein
MPPEAARPQGLFARLRSRLRGDRYMVDAHAPVAPAPAPAPAPVAAAPPTAKDG